MKKKIFAIALTAITLLSGTAMAQNPIQGSNKMRQPQTFRELAFEGILMTPEQQSRVDSLNASIDNARAQEKADREKSEKAAKEQRMQKRKDGRKAYLAKMKQILTPEQYVMFLENIYTSQPYAKSGIHKDRRGGKKQLRCNDTICWFEDAPARDGNQNCIKKDCKKKDCKKDGKKDGKKNRKDYKKNRSAN